MATKQDTKPPSKTGLDLLREPFPAHQISKLPKPTKAQTDAVRADFKKGIRCKLCGAWHHPDVVHLDYVGHAALTDRLLDCDPEWNWEPVARAEDGTPKIDTLGGMWIRLTVCGITRLGYGHADGKTGGDAIKEVIGDALRNAAMRFGAALDLWHKGDLHAIAQAEAKDDAASKRGNGRHHDWQPGQYAAEPPDGETPFDAAPGVDPQHEAAAISAASMLAHAKDMEKLKTIWGNLRRDIQHDPRVIKAKDGRKAELTGDPFDGGDPLPEELGAA